MNYKYALLSVVVLFYNATFSQSNHNLSIGFESNSQYYVDDDVTGDFDEEDPFRSNNYLKLNYSVGGVNVGLQAESYAPQHLLNYSPSYNKQLGFATYFASYTHDKWDITFGYFYEQYGNGLVLRSWEDRQLGINNAIVGAKASYRPSDRFSITGFHGKQRIGFEWSEGVLSGMDANYDLSSEKTTFQLGASLVNRQQDVNSNNSEFKAATQAYSGRMQFSINNFYSNIEGVIKTKDAFVSGGTIHDENLFYGNALLFEMGYSKKGFGVTSTLRRLENMNFFSDREAAGNTYNEQIINFLPGLTKQHDYTLTNLYVYQAQSAISFNTSPQKIGEIGGQFDVYYKIKKGTALGGKYGTKLAFNFSNWYGLDAEFNEEFQRVQVDPYGVGETYFRDANIEIRKKISKKLSGIVTFVNSYYNKGVIEEKPGIVKSNIFVSEATYKLTRKQSVRLEAQHLWTKDDKKNWAGATAEFNVNTNLSFFVNDMYNYGNDIEDENGEIHQDHYYNVGGSFSKNKSRFALSWGRTRGGLLCVGGVCREVPAATGLTFNVTTSF